MKLFILLTIFSLQRLFAVEVVKFNGEAFDLKTGKRLYYDHHEEYYEGGKHLYSIIQYKDTNGKVFAKKRIVFQKSPTKADFKLEDFRDGYIEGAEVNGDQIKFLYRKNEKEELKEAMITAPNNAVLDGGFDYFVRENWDMILAGNRKQLNLCAPSQLDCFKFVVYKTGEGKRKEADVVMMKVELNNALLAVFVKPILLVYNKETKKLLQYDGISNINNEDGKSHVVRIIYDNK
ncbi:MAG TPA: hypothetical protein PK079_10350 [Leptospiraceae bacterium]|nr:hypothetical protein [Leptospiraceae bacterium]HMW06176.1 hypothetical protein [Leptospiraceae bacterium]HMX30696.1 hypothetical protein [Leptospiraceae bacterium]HMY31837.1 hypothetical protein [Leptospiraceae bacterium]HMZ64953.1 hypothetical protein [Leptospiraceae bacterium]